jgi:hypothetical protein
MPSESYGISRKLTRPKRPELLPQIRSLVLSGRLSRLCDPQDMPPRTLRGLLLLEKPHELSAAYDRTRCVYSAGGFLQPHTAQFTAGAICAPL